MGDFDIHYTKHNNSYDITKLDAYLELKSCNSIFANPTDFCNTFFQKIYISPIYFL